MSATGHTIVVPREELRRVMRTAEMSAGIMRDKQRTGGWAGAENTARAFDRIGQNMRELLDLYSPETAPDHFSPRTVTPVREPEMAPPEGTPDER